MSFLKAFGFTSLAIVVGASSCSHKSHQPTTDATPTEVAAESRRQAALDRNKINLLKRIAIDENRAELEKCRATNPRHRKDLPWE